jgi:nucleoside-diphosphate-sugar epimerase
VHVLDIAHAFERVLAAPREAIHDEAFNVGRTGENYRIREVAEMVADVVPGCEVSFAANASADARDYRVDFGKIEQQLPGYAPQWTVRRGIEQLYEAYSSRGGMTPAAFAGPAYFRLRRIQQLRDEQRLDAELRWV